MKGFNLRARKRECYRICSSGFRYYLDRFQETFHSPAAIFLSSIIPISFLLQNLLITSMWDEIAFFKKKSKSKAFYCLRLRSEHNSYHYHHFLPKAMPWRWHRWWWNAVGWHWSYCIVWRRRLSHSWFGSRVHDLIPG